MLPATFEEIEARRKEAEFYMLDELLTAEELEQKREYEAETAAETAWLRTAENAGWEEALLESYYESGFRSPYN